MIASYLWEVNATERVAPGARVQKKANCGPAGRDWGRFAKNRRVEKIKWDFWKKKDGASQGAAPGEAGWGRGGRGGGGGGAGGQKRE